MEYLISGLTITAAMGTVSAATSLANGVYTLSDRIIKSTDSGVSDIKRLIEAEDLKNRIEIMDMFIKEIDVDDNTPRTITKAVESINAAIKDIEKELKNIQYRIDYNDGLYFSAGGTRYYKFNNSYKRLDAKIKTLNKRYETLRSMFSMRSLLNRNNLVTKNKQIQMSEVNLDEDAKLVERILTYEGDEYGVTESDDLEKSLEKEISALQ
jgi:hypothetical protein